jgi:coenzyme Q-binding protein COQ10
LKQTGLNRMRGPAKTSEQEYDGRGADALAETNAGIAVQRKSHPLGSSDAPHRAADLTTFKLIRHRWIDLFELVLDVKSYPAFVPHCRNVRLLSRKSDGPTRTIIVSRMTVGLLAFEVSYANRAVGDATARRINVNAIEGPFRYLHVIWKFEPVDDEHTDVEFSVNYEFANPILAGLASRVFTSMFGEIVNAFERRADQLFRRGRSGSPTAG